MDRWLDRHVDQDGARLRWRLEGNGPALVLLHGWALDLQSWDAVVPHLVSGFTVLRFDRRGFGLSEGQPDIHRNVEDLRALLDAAGIASAAVLGMSQGARFAIHFALRCPGMTSALVLDGAPEIEAESELPLEDYATLLESRGPAALQDEILAHPLMQLHTTDMAARAILQQSVGRYSGLDLLHAATRAHAPDLRRIHCPTLILNGSSDSDARRAAGVQLQSAIAGARRIELHGAGHMAMLDRPEDYAATVTAFLDRA